MPSLAAAYTVAETHEATPICISWACGGKSFDAVPLSSLTSVPSSEHLTARDRHTYRLFSRSRTDDRATVSDFGRRRPRSEVPTALDQAAGAADAPRADDATSDRSPEGDSHSNGAKEDAIAKVPLSPTLLTTLRAYYQWMRPKTWLFPQDRRRLARRQAHHALTIAGPCRCPVAMPEGQARPCLVLATSVSGRAR